MDQDREKRTETEITLLSNITFPGTIMQERSWGIHFLEWQKLNILKEANY